MAKNSSRRSRSSGGAALSRHLSFQNVDEAWLLDPKVTSLVKTQVEDADLVRARRSQFVTTAIRIFCRKGYHSATIKEIAAESGVSTGLIYQYVSDKEDVLFLALQLITHVLKEGLPAAIAQADTPIEKFVAVFDAYCRVIDAHRDACMLTYRETKSLGREHRGQIKGMELETNELIGMTVREGIAAGHFRKVDVQLFVYNAVMIAHTWALKHWRLSQLTTLDAYIQTNIEHLLNSIVTPEGRPVADQALAALKSGPSAAVARKSRLS